MAQLGLQFTNEGFAEANRQINAQRQATQDLLRANRIAARESVAAARERARAAAQEAREIEASIRQIQRAAQQRADAARNAAKVESQAAQQSIQNLRRQLNEQQNLTNRQRAAIQAQIVQLQRLINNRQQNTAETIRQINLETRTELRASQQRLDALRKESQERRRAAQQRQTEFDDQQRNLQRQLLNIDQSRRGLRAQNAAFDESTTRVQGFIRQLGLISPRTAGATNALANMVPVLGSVAAVVAGATIAIGALVIGIALLTAGISKLGTEGGRIEETISGFERTVGGIGAPAGVLQTMRDQTRGLVSDVDLMRLSLNALQGTTQEFRDVVGGNLGLVFDATGRVARATGRNADLIREKFIFGLRRSENRLLDDIGVKVDAIRANEAYAESIGKSADQLNAFEKQAAFAQEAIRQLNQIAGELGPPSEAVESAARTQANLANLKTQVQLSLAPLADVTNTLFADITGGITRAFQTVAPTIREIGNLIKGIRDDFRSIGEATGFSKVAGDANLLALPLQFVTALLRDMLRLVRGGSLVLSGFAQTARKTFETVAKSLSLGKVFLNLNKESRTGVENLAYILGFGGAAVVGAFANGMLSSANLVVEVVEEIAKLVASFLQGFSPPKVGPLSKIDLGGFNVGKAWVDGFVKGLLDFEKRANVLGFVNERLGVIGTFNLQQVETRLKQLDIAIRPFQERLEIVKSDMEAVAGFVDPALDAIERIRSRSIRALKRGEGDVEALRALDRQVGLLRTIQDLRQDQVDQAQLQLSLAQASQIQERTLLLIQQRRLQALDKEKDKKTKAAAAGGGGGETPLEESPIAPGGGPTGDVLPDILGDRTLPTVLDDLTAGAQAGLDAVGTSALFDNLKESSQNIADIIAGDPEADTESAIVTRFKTIRDDVVTEFNGMIEDLKSSATGLFSIENDPWSGIITNVEALKESILSKFRPIINFFRGGEEEEAFDKPIAESFSRVFGSGEKSTITVMKNNITGFVNDIITTFKGIAAFLLGQDENEFNLAANLSDALTAPVSTSVNAVVASVEGIIIGIMQGVNNLIEGLPGILKTGFKKATGLEEGLPVPEKGFLLNAVALARGQVGATGRLLVGEAGAELVTSPTLINARKPLNVFPARATAALIQMANYMAQHPTSHIMVNPGMSGSVHNTYDKPFQPVFNMMSPGKSRTYARQLYAQYG